MSEINDNTLLFDSREDWWVRFHKDMSVRAGIVLHITDGGMGILYNELKSRWNARIIWDKDAKDYFILFDSKEDKVAFVLRWL